MSILLKRPIFITVLVCLSCRPQSKEPIDPTPVASASSSPNTDDTPEPVEPSDTTLVGSLEEIEGNWSGNGAEGPYASLHSKKSLRKLTGRESIYDWKLEGYSDELSFFKCSFQQKNKPDLPKESDWRIGYCTGKPWSGLTVTKVTFRMDGDHLIVDIASPAASYKRYVYTLVLRKVTDEQKSKSTKEAP